MSDHGEKTCPLCAEEMDQTDQQLKPCKCGYQICVWCWHHIVDMAEKDQTEGRCPACRTTYDKEKIVGMAVSYDSLAPESNIERKKAQKSKSKPSEVRKQQLTNVRVIQRNLVYIVGLPLNLADEDLLHHKEYFGRYGKVLKVSMSRTATGVIQQFPNSTCSVYITYGKEEEAVRCIQAVHGFILDGRPLKACFGTTKYCHAWLRNVACINPDCLYLHEVGSQEDSFTKDEVVSAYTRNRVQQITGPTNILQNRSGSMLPQPLDAYSSESSSVKPIVKVPSNNATSAPRYSPPSGSGSGSSSRSTALPAAASWGTHIANLPSLATSSTSNGTSDIQRTTSVNGALPFSAVVANTAHVTASSSDILKRPSSSSRKEENQIVVEKSKPSVSKPLQDNVGVDSLSKRTTSPGRDPTSNQSSSSNDIDKLSDTVNSFEDLNEDVEDDSSTVRNLSVSVSKMNITTNSRDGRLDIHCDQGSIRQPGHDVSKSPHLDQWRTDSSTDTHTKAIPAENGISSTMPEWDWRSDLQSHTQVENNQQHHPKEDGIHSRFSSDRANDRLYLPNGYSEKSMSDVEQSLFASEARNKASSTEDDFSNILSLDFDPWDESLPLPLLNEVDQQSSNTPKPSNLLKQHNNQSRFAFARYEESSSGSENHSIYGQFPRDHQPIQESLVSRDTYRDNLGNGFTSNYSGGLDNFAATPLYSSSKNPIAVSRPQVSAPPGFSSPSRSPPPGFSSHERAGRYQAQLPVGNTDMEFVDPAILAVGRGMVNSDLDMRFQQSSFGQQQEVNGFHHHHNDLRSTGNFSPSVNDPYGFNNSRLQTQGSSSSSLSSFLQLPRQQEQLLFGNSELSSNGHWDNKWNRNERLGLNGSLYSNGYEEPNYRISSPGDAYSRTYGI